MALLTVTCRYWVPQRANGKRERALKMEGGVTRLGYGLNAYQFRVTKLPVAQSREKSRLRGAEGAKTRAEADGDCLLGGWIS